MRGLVFAFLISLFAWGCSVDLEDDEPSCTNNSCLVFTDVMRHTPSTMEIVADVSKGTGLVDVAFCQCKACSDNRNHYVLPSSILHDGGSIPVHPVKDNQCSGFFLDANISFFAATLPLDENHHLRFDLLDTDKVVKSYDIDMEPYLNAYVKDGNTFKVSAYDNGRYLTYYSLVGDTTVPDFRVNARNCYQYGVSGSNGSSMSFSESIDYVYCFENTLKPNAVKNGQWIIDDVIDRADVQDSLKDLFGSSLTSISYLEEYLWQSSYGLSKQSSFKTDSIVIRVKYSE